MIYDYYGFAKAAYEIEYSVSGAPDLADKVFKLLGNAGIGAELDDRRGFDHGLFVPLKLMYPDADIPCIQLSLVNNLQPEQHIRIGKALAGLKKARSNAGAIAEERFSVKAKARCQDVFG